MAKNQSKTSNIVLKRNPMDQAYRMDETKAVQDLLEFVKRQNFDQAQIAKTARSLIEQVRKTPKKTVAIENFLQEFGLTTPEGIALMCLAEALLRVPDSDTAALLIEDKLTKADWSHHIKSADDTLLSLSSWALMMSGKVMDEGGKVTGASQKSVLGKVVKRLGEPVIHKAMMQAMKILGQQFVMGQTIESALDRAVSLEEKGFRYSYDMLGEGARTMADADRYFEVYSNAIETIGQTALKNLPKGDHRNRPGISVKISALHPRYEFSHREHCLPVLTERLKKLCLQCKQYNIGLTVDAEETERLDISFDLIESVFLDPDLDGWEGFGLALQGYQKRAFYAIDWLKDLSKKAGRKLMVRLVKGAYWDSEIKHTQVEGLAAYPVFTRKASTDLSYNACAVKLMMHTDCFYPQLATHNAHTVSTVLTLAKTLGIKDFEFQRLHGMAEPLFEQVMQSHGTPCRIYAPVGTHKDLLPYLVRRMLENGANSSFVYKIMDPEVAIDDLIQSPLDTVESYSSIPHPKIALPSNMYGAFRRNSAGYDLEERGNELDFQKQATIHTKKDWVGASIVSGKLLKTKSKNEKYSPQDPKNKVGNVFLMPSNMVSDVIAKAQGAFDAWTHTGVMARATMLERCADLLEENRDRFMTLCSLEAGKTLKDGVDEVREAVDFCRYYAAMGRNLFANPIKLPGPTGEDNILTYHGRGVFACISPWNFPLAIFMGQVTAALMAGNCVIAKPAEQTSIIATEAVKLLHEAGIPKDVLQLVVGKGSQVGPVLVADERIKGICFTGSTGVAKQLQRGLADREGAIVPLIAETGGQNSMIVDNTALPEQVVDDVIRSAFLSAGQRCSALRVLFVQEEIAKTVIPMLKGAMDELVIGDPIDPATDIGPVIDSGALKGLKDHIDRMKKEATYLHGLDVPKTGSFCPPHLFEISSINQLTDEVFGPILHVVCYKGKDLPKIIDAVNSTGFGLTLGIHSRIDFAVQDIAGHIRVGNAYVNRSMTGAVVGVQPFGGEGLSGTGPKAGGPNYLQRFATERVLSVDTTASGGNASLISLTDE